MPFSAHPTSPQAFGWFKRPIKNLADFKGMKCRQTGINAEVFQRMGMSTVNMPGGEIIPAAQRGVIDCAEWVGGIEDLRLGLHQVWKYHYTPGLHENNTIGELTFNLDVWKSLAPVQQEQVRSALRDAFISWIAKNQKENADALREFREKHGVQVLRTPPEILVAYLKAWDDLAQEEAGKNPFFKKVMDSQRAWAAVSVPAKRFMLPPYSFAANYYWPEARLPPRQQEVAMESRSTWSTAWRRRSATTATPCGSATCCSSPASRPPTSGKVVGGDDVAAQTRQVFKNMKLVLDAAGASFADILKVTVYLLDVNDRSKINPVRKEFFGAARPASTLIGINQLAIPGMKVEIEAVVGLRLGS